MFAFKRCIAGCKAFISDDAFWFLRGETSNKPCKNCGAFIKGLMKERKIFRSFIKLLPDLSNSYWFEPHFNEIAFTIFSKILKLISFFS